MHKVFVFLTAVSLLSGVCGLEVLAEGQRSFRDARAPWKMSIGSDNMGGQSSLCDWLLTCSQDKTAIIWNAKTVATYRHMVLWDSVNGRISRNLRGTYWESRLNGMGRLGLSMCYDIVKSMASIHPAAARFPWTYSTWTRRISPGALA